MSLRARMHRLEGQAALLHLTPGSQPNVLPELATQTAEPSGEGWRLGDPPRPPWFEPVAWVSHRRVCWCIEDRLAGQLGETAFGPALSEAEQTQFSGYWKALMMFRDSALEEEP